MSTKVSFAQPAPGFSAALRKSVQDYFAKNGIKSTGNFKLFSKTIILISILIATYTSLLFIDMPGWVSVLLCIILGLDVAAIGFNVMHDGAHGSYSSKKWVNDIMGMSLNIIGGNEYLWKQKHNQNHHTYTNVEGLDDDIDIQPWIRTNKNQKKYWFHKYQHIYWVALYGLTYLLWVYVKDFTKYFTGKIGDTDMKKMSVKDHVIFWFSKAVYFFIFLALPIMMVGAWKTLIGYLIFSFTTGFVIAIVFQMAHIVEATTFPMPEEGTNKINEEWMVHQLATTANFSTRSKIISWFAGGLNFQVEHHLFPKISHIHYPEISKIVKDVCRKFNVQYNEYPNLLSVLKSHVMYLKTAGNV
ncbi:MAG: acyl-CoA desaturase [Bacteroidia bacterium]